ncbi:hypothetical protein [Dechloromonas denitrificans]|uniref:hypothetical protein n=1 Tax=Dechloromonas denitrificans TaxID=281362 RepID=UPI001CF80D45|nr:hypothetical protein [Dechloromonas denitrificans]UCV02017.1 hypothetical protein KI611_12970 [Dechloromonas denitrificans]UCV06352.1 hypothetical protein KI615_13055 [Dechloromonas denitrificans]
MTNSRHNSGLEQNESKSMSILRDLDPQNATIHHNARVASKGNKTVWMLVLLLLSGGAIGLFLTNQSGQHLPATNDTVATAVSTAESSASAASAPSNLAPPPAAPGTAEIRENQGERKLNKASEQSALLAMQMELEKTRGEQPTGNTPAPVSKQKTVATDQHPKTTNSSAKSSRNTAKRSTADGTRTAKAEKKPAERDIDIITAIVK